MYRVKRILAMALAAVMFMGLFMGYMPAKSAKAADLVIKLHYHRNDGIYDNWDVWLWESGKDGKAYAFEDVNGEKVASMTVTPGTSSVGFIVRLGDWTKKDIDSDQFINIEEMLSGTIHVYVESGVMGYTSEYGDDAVIGIKVSAAKYVGNRQIAVKFTGKPERVFKDDVTVSGPSGNVSVLSVTDRGNNIYYVDIAEEPDSLQTYFLTYDGTDYRISIPSIYSTDEFESEYTYKGNDLGAVWTAEKTTFRLWAPSATEAYVNLYETGTHPTKNLIRQIEMKGDVNGTWVAEAAGDLNGTYYTFSVLVGGEIVEACDPYARTTGVNGKRAMVIDLDSTDPEGWENDKDPNSDLAATDMIIYELQIRDLASDKDSGIRNVGKYLEFTETGTKTPGGAATGIDHIRELGVTHLHILPFYDFGSIDESSTRTQYNWGYDPVNYNVPEGSYSTDAAHGEVRVNEVKQMVKSLHDNGISVVMDVVYNHVYNSSEFCFNQLVPGYFSRIDDNGNNSNGSGCGNDTASERSMVRKYIVDSVSYWADEYHIDGFRFDLVGLLDVDTINEIVNTVHEKHPNVKFYGEGWTMTTSVTKDEVDLCTQTNSKKVPGFAFFNDDIRDGLKGSVFDTTSLGYATGAKGKTDTIANALAGSMIWCKNPSQIINYASCHDNNTLYDRITVSRPDATVEDIIRMNNLSAAIYLTAEGIPFMQAGEEMLRSKAKTDGTFDSNSYASPDYVNGIKWSVLDDESYMNVFEYYKGLIAFRKAHPVLRLSAADDVKTYVTRITEGLDPNVIVMQYAGGAEGETAESIISIFNPNEGKTTVKLPKGKWTIYVNGEKAGTKKIKRVSKDVTVDAISAMILVKEKTSAAAVIGITAACAAVLAGGTFVFLKTKKKQIADDGCDKA